MPTDVLEIAVCPDPPADEGLLKAAARLSVDLGLPMLERPRKTGFDMLLAVTPQRVELRVLRGAATVKGGRPVFADLAKLDTASHAGASTRQPIARAVGIRRKADPRPTVIDAAAGFGEDAWLLAALGCRVLAVERSKVVATLLRDGVLRAGAQNPEIFARLSLVNTDARHMLRRMAGRGPADDLPAEMKAFTEPQVVYLDPMFPPGRKTAERKPLRVLRSLVGGDEDADLLLEAALRVAARRVVVKRPLHAGPLGDRKPTTSHKGKSLRYDVYATA